MRIFYYFIERRILLSQIIFVLFLILSLHSCKKSSSGFINPDIHFQAFENKWKLYNKSTNGGWKNNFNGRYSWDDAYALEGLLMHYQRSSDKRYVDTFIKVASRILETSDDDLKINDKYRGNKIVKGWSSKRYTVDSSYHVFGITNAMILYPVVKLFNILQDKNEIIQENISFFNKFKLFFIDEFNNIQVNDWVNLSSESGYFQDPYYSGLGIITPVNQYSRIGSYAIELYKLTGDLKYLVYAKKVARHLKNNLIQFSSYYYWNYIITSQPSPSDKPEDLGHSILVIQFIVNCYKNNIIFDQNDVQKLVYLFKNQLYIENSNSFREYLIGQLASNDPYVSHYYLLSEYDYGVYQTLSNWLSKQDLKLDESSFLNHFGNKLILLDAFNLYYK